MAVVALYIIKINIMNADTYAIFLHLHSIGRWIILLLLLIAIFNSMVAGNRPWIRTDARTGTILVIFADLMFIIGLVIWYFGNRGYKLIETEKAILFDYMNMLKINGEWKIVSKIFSRQNK